MPPIMTGGATGTPAITRTVLVQPILQLLEARHRAECPLCGEDGKDGSDPTADERAAHAQHRRRPVMTPESRTTKPLGRLARWWRG
jgi:hypothetical protein